MRELCAGQNGWISQKLKSDLMKPKVIKTDSEYAAVLARIDKLMNAKANTPQGDELELLSLLVRDVERGGDSANIRRLERDAELNSPPRWDRW